MGRQAKIAVQLLGFLALAAGMGGCTPEPSSSDTLVHGKVVTVGKTHLLVDDGHSVNFVSITPLDRSNLEGLKKGDAVTLVTKNGTDNSVEVEQVILPGDKHIMLGQEK